MPFPLPSDNLSCLHSLFCIIKRAHIMGCQPWNMAYTARMIHSRVCSTVEISSNFATPRILGVGLSSYGYAKMLLHELCRLEGGSLHKHIGLFEVRARSISVLRTWRGVHQLDSALLQLFAFFWAFVAALARRYIPKSICCAHTRDKQNKALNCSWLKCLKMVLEGSKKN